MPSASRVNGLVIFMIRGVGVVFFLKIPVYVQTRPHCVKKRPFPVGSGSVWAKRLDNLCPQHLIWVCAYFTKLTETVEDLRCQGFHSFSCSGAGSSSTSPVTWRSTHVDSVLSSKRRAPDQDNANRFLCLLALYSVAEGKQCWLQVPPPPRNVAPHVFLIRCHV